jgi:hypothetical protein
LIMTRGNRRLSPTALAALTVLPVLAGPTARAELLYFTRGGCAQVPAQVRDHQVLVALPFGSFSFQEKEFVRIIPGHDPEGEWPERRKAAMAGDVGARLDAAWWALENGLIAESVAMIRAAHDRSPRHPLAQRLAFLVDRLELPCPDRQTAQLRRALSEPVNEARSAHVLLLHQQGPAEARERVELLENVVTAIYLWFAFHGIDLPPPSGRLVSVYLRDHESYLQFLECQNAGAFRATEGYFHPTFRAIIAYDPRSALRQGQQASSADGLRPQSSIPRSRGFGLSALGHRVGKFPLPPRTVCPDQFEPGPVRTTEQERRRFLDELDFRAHDLGVAAHEMVHLVVADCGLASDVDRFPLWLQEGLAAQFEVVRGGRWAGVGRANDLRLAHWRSSAERHRLVPLVKDAGFGHGYRSELYAECWALVYFLERARGAEFRALLDLYRAPYCLGVQTGADRKKVLFHKAFCSDPGELEEAWTWFMDSVRSPVEENRPEPGSVPQTLTSRRN